MIRDRIWINGVDVADSDIHVLSLPPYVAPRKRVRRYEIPGRSGELTVEDGSWEETERMAELLYIGDDPAGATRFLLDAENVRFANEPDKVYECLVLDGFEVPRTINQSHRFNVIFRCGLARELVPTVLTGTNVVLNNQTNTIAFPRIEVTTTGIVTITTGADTITVTGVTGTLIIDSELGIVKDEAGNAWGRLTGRLPEIKPGEIMTISSAQSMTIKPNWRWA